MKGFVRLNVDSKIFNECEKPLYNHSKWGFNLYNAKRKHHSTEHINN